MKMQTMVILLIIIQIVGMLFDNTITTEGASAVPGPYNYTYDNTNSSSSNWLYDYAMNPLTWTESGIINYIIIFLVAWAIFQATGFSASFLASGISKTPMAEYGFWAPLAGILFGVGFIPISMLFGVITREVGAFACEAGTYCSFGIIIGGLMAGLLAVQWLLLCLKWWRKGDIE